MNLRHEEEEEEEEEERTENLFGNKFDKKGH